MSKKLQTMRVGNMKIITAAEHLALDRKIKKRYDSLRKQYKEIRGKRLDWISHNCEEGLLYVDIRFTDGTHFSLQFSPQILMEGIEFSDMSSGDDEIIKVYYRRRDDC